MKELLKVFGGVVAVLALQVVAQFLDEYDAERHGKEPTTVATTAWRN